MTEVQDILTVTRELDAPPHVVWEAWTDPVALARWWWPARFETTYQVDLRVGGRYSFRTVDVPGMGVLAVGGTFLEIHPPERLVYTWWWEGKEDAGSRVTAEFLERNGGTLLRITQKGFPSADERENHAIGWGDCLDRLVTLLSPKSVDGAFGAQGR